MKSLLDRLVSRGKRLALSSLHSVHRGLFDALLPEAMRDLAPQELAAASERVWLSVAKTPAAQWTLWLLGHLDVLSDPRVSRLYARLSDQASIDAEALQAGAEPLRRFLASQATSGRARSLADLSPEARRRLLSLLLDSPLELQRRVGLGVRMLYYVRLFEGRTGRSLAEVSEPIVAQWSPEPGVKAPELSSHLRYDEQRREIVGELDYIVVGSGCAGAVVAHELQRAGKRVLVVEAGSFFAPGTYDARAGLDFYEGRGLRTTSDGGIFVLNGETVGGGGTINVDMAFPPTLPFIAARVERWRSQGLIPEDLWTRDELARASTWVAERFGTRQVREAEINTHNRLLLLGGRARGLSPSCYELNTYAPGSSPLRRSDKRGPVESLLLPALQAAHKPVSLLPDARVLRVLFEQGRAVGVELQAHAPMDKVGIVSDPCKLRVPAGVNVKVRAPHVVLAGGNLGSSALLLRSGIRHPMTGRGFVMHPFLLLIGDFNERIDGHAGLSSSVYASDFITTNFDQPQPDFLLEVAAARPEVCAAMCPGSPAQVYRMVKNYRNLGGLGVVLLDEASPSNRVDLDRFGKPRISYQLSDADKRRFRQGLVEGAEILFAAGAERILLPSFETRPTPTGEQGIISSRSAIEPMISSLQFRSNQTPLFAAHMMAGNKLGLSAEQSVVTPDYEVRGTRGLYVADASVFPGSIGANPMQSIYCVAKIFCDRHLART